VAKYRRMGGYVDIGMGGGGAKFRMAKLVARLLSLCSNPDMPQKSEMGDVMARTVYSRQEISKNKNVFKIIFFVDFFTSHFQSHSTAGRSAFQPKYFPLVWAWSESALSILLPLKFQLSLPKDIFERKLFKIVQYRQIYIFGLEKKTKSSQIVFDAECLFSLSFSVFV
jgi:hypothetical protein